MNQRKIRWQRWAHPLGGGDEWVWEKGQGGAPEWSDNEDASNKPPIRPVLLTASGLIPVTTYADMNREFDLWIGHATFYITEGEGEVEDTIVKTPGVEAMSTLSPYRFLIAVGRCFDAYRVRCKIEERLDAVPGLRMLNAGTRDKVTQLAEVFRKRHRNWALYVLPNLAIDTTHSADPDEFGRRLDVYEEARALAGGLIFTAHDFE